MKNTPSPIPLAGRILGFLAFLVSATSLTAELQADFKQGDRVDSHLVRLPALFVAEGQPATPFLETGPFEVTWTGNLTLEKRQRLYFSFAGQGDASLQIDGEEVLSESGTLGAQKSARLRLSSGEHQVVLRYQAPESGGANFQLNWEERSFPTEPVPPGIFSPPSSEKPASALAYQGREIFARHLCIKCHLPQDGIGPDAMPELTHVPPLLALTGDRLKEDWLARWIANPAAYRPDTNMPRLVPDSADGRQQAADLAAYLMTMQTGAEASELLGKAQDGGASFHQLACVTCHGLPDEVSPSDERVPLVHLAEKFQPHALRDFLLNPSQLSPHTRMPDFRLDEEEASNLASYLLATNGSVKIKQIAFPSGDASRGPELSKQMQCGACHAGLPYDPTAMPPFEDIAQKPWTQAACFDGASSHLNLPTGAGEALEALRTQHLASLQRDTPASLAQRQLKSLRCAACHSRDDQAALLASLHSESATLIAHLEAAEQVDQSLPLLTHTGEMLHTDYLGKILAGQAEPRPRPWLEARMPGFGNHSPDTFAAGLAAQHGLAPSKAEADKADKGEPNEETIALGKELVGSEKGFGCTTCHGVGAQGTTAAFEVMGINFDLTQQRLRNNFFHRWMHNPTRINPATKMPRYADDKGESSLPALDSDSRAQFEAIWQYLQSIE